MTSAYLTKPTRSEFEARIERAVGARISHFHFPVDYENRCGDLECGSAAGRNYDEARTNAFDDAAGTGLRVQRVVSDWNVVFFDDGRFFDRGRIEQLLKSEATQ